MKIITKSSNETIELGKKIGSLLHKGDVVFLSGDLGAGKTTFTKGIGISLGVKRVINSPTFTIVKKYDGNITLNHIDLYRIDNLEHLEIEEYFNDNEIVVCEWPKEELNLIKDSYLKINIYNIDEVKREFEVIGVGDYYEKIVRDLK